MNEKQFKADLRTVQFTYWLIIAMIVIVFLASCGGCFWMLWLLTQWVQR